MTQVNIRLNGKQIQADAGHTILDVATAQGISIPTLCHDKRLKPFGSCRVCLVKGEEARNFVPSCSTLVAEGMMIDTEGEDVVTARRLALYRRTRNEMPANDFEIEEAKEEGVEFHFLAAPTSISQKDGQLNVKCIRMELGPPDESGRRRPVPIADSGFTMDAHYLITAIGQHPDISCIEQERLVTARDRIKADPETGSTDIDSVFAGGDCVTGAEGYHTIRHQ